MSMINTSSQIKRFYKLVDIAAHNDGGYEIHLDGRPVKTPLRHFLIAPTEKLAQAVMAEWYAQGDNIVPDTMPITQLISTKIDRVRPERAAMTEMVLKYLDTDMICYRTDFPPELSLRQSEVWDVYIDWFKNKFGTVLKTTTELKALSQDKSAHAEVKKIVEGLDEDRFTILQMITALSGSLVLALAFIDGAYGVESIFRAMRVDDDYKDTLYKEDIHGGDPMQNKRDVENIRDISACRIYLESLN